MVEMHNLRPGTYTVLPSTFNEGEERGFVVEAFALKPGMTLTKLEAEYEGGDRSSGW
jgi:hypothetical protein